MAYRVIIIGAGPTGLLLAHYLMRRGHYQVELYERRPDPRYVDVSKDRTFPISLQARGRKALQAIPGMEEAIIAESIFCYGTVVYRKRGQPRRIARKFPNLTIDRNRLVRVLLQHLMEQYPERVTVQFGCSCTHIDSQTKTVTIQPEQGESFTVRYDGLVGADGARSPVREHLIETTDLQCEQEIISDAYKSLFLQRRNSTTGTELDSDKIHTWNLDNKTRVIVVPQPNDQLNGVIIFDAAQNPIEALSTPEAVLTFFQENFPLFGQVMSSEEAAAFVNRPVSRVLTVRCDRFHHEDQIVLLGDSAHAVSPSIGQGCNASLEDVWIFGQLLDTYTDDWSKVLPAFSQQRLPDAHALQDLSNYSFPRNKWLVLEFFLRLTAGRLLNRWFPQWISPFVFDLVLETDLPYAKVLELNQGWITKVKRAMTQTGQSLV